MVTLILACLYIFTFVYLRISDNDEYSSKLKKKQEARSIKKSLQEKETKTNGKSIFFVHF